MCQTIYSHPLIHSWCVVVFLPPLSPSLIIILIRDPLALFFSSYLQLCLLAPLPPLFPVLDWHHNQGTSILAPWSWGLCPNSTKLLLNHYFLFCPSNSCVTYCCIYICNHCLLFPSINVQMISQLWVSSWSQTSSVSVSSLLCYMELKHTPLQQTLNLEWLISSTIYRDNCFTKQFTKGLLWL